MQNYYFFRKTDFKIDMEGRPYWDLENLLMLMAKNGYIINTVVNTNQALISGIDTETEYEVEIREAMVFYTGGTHSNLEKLIESNFKYSE